MVFSHTSKNLRLITNLITNEVGKKKKKKFFSKYSIKQQIRK